MAVLFVSHASKDDRAASALEAWLHANGFTDVFVDHDSIAGGEKWQQRLRESAGSCRVLTCLVTPNWLASHECFGEFVAAWYMGKRIIPLFLVPPSIPLSDEQRKRLARVCAEDQGIMLDRCLTPDATLDLTLDRDAQTRLKQGLRAAGAERGLGLDPHVFPINRSLRPSPFPGLASFGDDDADAALFFGRSREIADVLEELRKMRAERDLRPFIILGASGAGKSSLLKAGIIPRLRREAPAWLPLRAFRPGSDPLLNFAEALVRTFADFGRVEAPGVVRDRLLQNWVTGKLKGGPDSIDARLDTVKECLNTEGARLRNAADCPDATILISVDQAEEIVRAEGQSGDALADYLRAALLDTTDNWQLAFAIRSDSFPELQRHGRFEDLRARAYALRAVPVFRYTHVVEEPAKRYGIEIAQPLADALIEDTPRDDALPILAFVLQRLWTQYATSGELTRDHYDKVGGLRGIIEDAAERALRAIEPGQDVPLPPSEPPKRLLDVAASTFVPALAQVTEQGATLRRVAEWASFDKEQQALLHSFERWRLLIRKSNESGTTVEVAHEALFREWTRLRGWLEPERARLDAMRALQIDAAAWERSGRDAGFLNHRGKRLHGAAGLVQNENYRKRLTKTEFEYVAACQLAERLLQKRTKRVHAALGALTVAIGLAITGWLSDAYLREQWRWATVTRPYMLEEVRPYVLRLESERALDALQTFRECARDCPLMTVIPLGAFAMGSPPIERGRDDNEGPQHDVVIARRVAVSKFELTFADWDACERYGDCPHVSDSGWGRERRPVINVTWNDTQRYIAWLSRMTGKPYRLLSESEWEYSARAGTTGMYSFGDDPAMLGSYAWYFENAAGRTHPVGEKRPNAFGLYDVHGNVWEWVQDCYHETYQGAPTDGSAWIEDADCNGRVARGGAWGSGESRRVAARQRLSTDVRNYNIGFRIGRTLASDE